MPGKSSRDMIRPKPIPSGPSAGWYPSHVFTSSHQMMNGSQRWGQKGNYGSTFGEKHTILTGPMKSPSIQYSPRKAFQELPEDTGQRGRAAGVFVVLTYN